MQKEQLKGHKTADTTTSHWQTIKHKNEYKYWKKFFDMQYCTKYHLQWV